MPKPRTIENLLEKLTDDDLKDALAASDTLMQHTQFMPPEGLLLMLVSKFRDDVREQLGMKPERPPSRGNFTPLGQLTTPELAALENAVDTLLEPRFVKSMDDPDLSKGLLDFRDELTKQKIERAQMQASSGA